MTHEGYRCKTSHLQKDKMLRKSKKQFKYYGMAFLDIYTPHVWDTHKLKLV